MKPRPTEAEFNELKRKRAEDGMSERWTPGPWHHFDSGVCWQIDNGKDAVATTQFCYARETEANARLIAAAPTQDSALNYVADNTYCGADGEWHFKPGYDPRIVLDALACARGEP